LLVKLAREQSIDIGYIESSPQKGLDDCLREHGAAHEIASVTEGSDVEREELRERGKRRDVT